ncbi:hypothetical protein QUB47_06805 [Microcoleus sp. AT9_B5]
MLRLQVVRLLVQKPCQVDRTTFRHHRESNPTQSVQTSCHLLEPLGIHLARCLHYQVLVIA